MLSEAFALVKLLWLYKTRTGLTPGRGSWPERILRNTCGANGCKMLARTIEPSPHHAISCGADTKLDSGVIGVRSALQVLRSAGSRNPGSLWSRAWIYDFPDVLRGLFSGNRGPPQRQGVELQERLCSHLEKLRVHTVSAGPPTPFPPPCTANGGTLAPMQIGRPTSFLAGSIPSGGDSAPDVPLAAHMSHWLGNFAGHKNSNWKGPQGSSSWSP